MSDDRTPQPPGDSPGDDTPDMAAAELAERESVPLGTMKSWVRRGLARLRECLER